MWWLGDACGARKKQRGGDEKASLTGKLWWLMYGAARQHCREGERSGNDQVEVVVVRGCLNKQKRMRRRARKRKRCKQERSKRGRMKEVTVRMRTGGAGGDGPTVVSAVAEEGGGLRVCKCT